MDGTSQRIASWSCRYYPNHHTGHVLEGYDSVMDNSQTRRVVAI